MRACVCPAVMIEHHRRGVWRQIPIPATLVVRHHRQIFAVVQNIGLYAQVRELDQ